MASQTEPSHHKHSKYILISNCESYVGHALAHHLASELMLRPGMMKKHWRVRALCHNLQGMEDLIQAGVDVQQVNYQDEMMLRSQMKHVRSLIITMGTNESRVTDTIKVITVASSEKVKRVQMISCTGCQYAESEQSPMGQYHMLEQLMRSTFAYGRWCVFRLTFMNQGFYFWKDMIEHSGKIGMSMSETTQFTTISIQDVCDALATLVLSPKKQDIEGSSLLAVDDDEDDEENPEHLKRIYELTGQCPYTGEFAARKLNEALGAEEGEIQYEEMSEEELREYLHRMSARPNQADPPGLVPDPHRYLNEQAINIMLDWFKILERTGMGQKVTDDIRDLTGREPKDLGQFFIENRNEFRRPSK
ncbi:hypothetical protein BDB00DRAFT_926582 [Zychaea mexicana]|uniref:uncharacterized protein n=1 Tax=Zychaea mexicana TaxID=64656 RepID=UPI0022FF3C75|nr:uncharacterized protein BDB00DRAFT_926582 [Zychaea mexicana]KAI9496699.1 hypothetical protein BDB00DRAFT_926582 [Zychaea mexicana]